MLARLKQKVKEKTGRSKATSYPADVEDAMSYFKALLTRVKDLHKGMNDLNEVFKWQKKADFLAILENCSKLGDKVKVQPFIKSVNARIAAEADSMRGIQNEIEKFRMFSQGECKFHQDNFSYLNKARLEMDSAADKYANNESDINKMRLDACTKDFEVACSRVRELTGTIPDIESNHSSWQEALMKEMKVAFRK